MIRTNEAFIFSQLWLIIAARSTNDYDQNGMAMIPEINFISVSQKTSSSTSSPLHNIPQHSHQQHDERRLLKESPNRRFQYYQQKKEAETLVDNVKETLVKFPVVTFVHSYASNDTRLIPPAYSGTLQNVALPVLPNSEDDRSRRKKLLNNTEAFEEDNKKDEEGYNGLNNNVIDMEFDIRRKMERTTIEVRNYPPVTKASPSPVTAINPDHVSGLSILATPVPLPLTPNHSLLHDLDFGIRTTVSYENHVSSLPPSIIQDQRHNQVFVYRQEVTELSTIPSFVTTLPPVALPIPLNQEETSFNLFDAQLQNSGISAVISDGHSRNSDTRNSKTTEGTLEQQRQLPEKIPIQTQIHPREYEPVDDILGCTWDIVTNSCKDLFSLKLCSHCHDFGNIFLHNCKCLVKFITTF